MKVAKVNGSMDLNETHRRCAECTYLCKRFIHFWEIVTYKIILIDFIDPTDEFVRSTQRPPNSSDLNPS
jgi:hypothetical protein